MGIVRGETVIARAVAERSLTQLQRWGAKLDRAVQQGDAPSMPAKLREIDAPTFQRIAEVMGGSFLWVNDGFCLSRATLGAFRADQHVAELAKHGRLAPANVEAAVGAAVLRTTKRIPAKYVDGENKWNYHSAMALRLQGHEEPMAIDYLLFDDPVPLSVWAQRLGLKSKDIEIYAPTDPTVQEVTDWAPSTWRHKLSVTDGDIEAESWLHEVPPAADAHARKQRKWYKPWA
jgi:hypothetical protein